MPHTRLAVVGSFVCHHLLTPDPDAAAGFYGRLFGWARREIRSAGAPGVTTFRSGDSDVATAGQLDVASDSRWLPCLAVADLGAAQADADRLGGTRPNGEETAEMVVMADPCGARFGLSQANAGCTATADAAAPGRFCWTELATDNPEASSAFYRQFAGWTSVERHVGRQGRYWVFRSGTKDVGGMVHEPGAPIASCWVPYVQVISAEETAALAVELGGTLLVPPGDVPGRGRYAVFKDPAGAVVGVFALTDAA